jgi:hypothetical protein
LRGLGAIAFVAVVSVVALGCGTEVLDLEPPPRRGAGADGAASLSGAHGEAPEERRPGEVSGADAGCVDRSCRCRLASHFDCLPEPPPRPLCRIERPDTGLAICLACSEFGSDAVRERICLRCGDVQTTRSGLNCRVCEWDDGGGRPCTRCSDREGRLAVDECLNQRREPFVGPS